MTTKRLGLLALIVLSVGTGCSDVSTVVSPDTEVLFARKPGGDKATDNKSCENPTSGSPVRNAPKEKNQCEGGSTTSTFTVTVNSNYRDVLYVGLNCDPAGVTGTGGGPFSLCETYAPFNSDCETLGLFCYNVLVNVYAPTGVSANNGATCALFNFDGVIYSYVCNVVATGTVITVEEAP